MKGYFATLVSSKIAYYAQHIPCCSWNDLLPRPVTVRAPTATLIPRLVNDMNGRIEIVCRGGRRGHDVLTGNQEMWIHMEQQKNKEKDWRKSAYSIGWIRVVPKIIEVILRPASWVESKHTFLLRGRHRQRSIHRGSDFHRPFWAWARSVHRSLVEFGDCTDRDTSTGPW
jgi:hypothetical protein